MKRIKWEYKAYAVMRDGIPVVSDLHDTLWQAKESMERYPFTGIKLRIAHVKVTIEEVLDA